jgi:hypothetical protein
MKSTIDEAIRNATPDGLFEQVARLEHYPAWMRLVHRVSALEPDESRLAWWVELRARIGPLARSKQLRMVRTVFDPADRRVRFERVERDDREHAAWILTAEVGDRVDDSVAGVTPLRVHLEYTGQLWSASILGRILDDEVRRGVAALTRMFSEPSPTR